MEPDTCPEKGIRIIIRDLTPKKDFTRGRDFNGSYKKQAGRKNGHPYYEQMLENGKVGENRIWYCRAYECLFDGWVIGKKEKVKPSDRLFSKARDKIINEFDEPFIEII